MQQTNQLSFGDSPQKKAFVVSHERSGTHFLMNSLALNFGYVSSPWFNLDYEKGLNFHSADGLLRFFRQMHDRPLLNIVKSHHQAAFFSPLMEYLTEQFHCFYIYRNPGDVMTSFWQLLNDLDWDEGPRADSAGEFIRSAPRGAILRYQKEQSPTLLHRWKEHIDGWLNLAAVMPGIHLVSYEDLSQSFDDTLAGISRHINRPVDTPIKPVKEKNTILPGMGVTGRHRDFFTADDIQFMQEITGDVIDRINLISQNPVMPGQTCL